MKLRRFKEEKSDMKVVEESNYTDKLDLCKDLIKIHSDKLLDNVTSDVVLAKFTEMKDKVYVVEMQHCSYLCKSIIDKISFNYKLYQETHGKKIKDLTTNEIRELDNNSKQVQSLFNGKIVMVSVVNRNVANNYLIKNVVGSMDIEEDDVDTDKMSDVMAKTKDKLKNEEVRQ